MTAIRAVAAGNAVHARRESHGRHRHVETVVVEHRVMAEPEEVLAADPHLLPHRACAVLDLFG